MTATFSGYTGFTDQMYITIPRQSRGVVTGALSPTQDGACYAIVTGNRLRTPWNKPLIVVPTLVRHNFTHQGGGTK